LCAQQRACDQNSEIAFQHDSSPYQES
jgi:hypothetical protein